jgi:lipoprotein-anchoring transpeptidase ErfK/SrfK
VFPKADTSGQILAFALLQRNNFKFPVHMRLDSRTMRSISLGTLALLSFVLLAPTSSSARQIVHFSGYSAGTIIVRTSERRLYYVLNDDRAIRYPVGVGRRGMTWEGTVYVDGKYIEPSWSAPLSIRKDYSRLPAVIPGGSAHNPMGVAAMTLSGGGQYAIHGTNNPASVGHFVSHGCIRMYNNDVMDLYQRVSYGTKVVVLR